MGVHFLPLTPAPTVQDSNNAQHLQSLRYAKRCKEDLSLQEAVPRFCVTTVLFSIRCSVPLDSDIPHTLEAVTHRYHDQLSYSSGVFPSKGVTTYGLGYLEHCGFSLLLGTQLTCRIERLLGEYSLLTAN